MEKNQRFFKVAVLFETDIVANGCSYLVMYGKHVNGYFCCIPNFGYGCEMSDPNDTAWNYNSLIKTGIDKTAAKHIVGEIKNIMKQIDDPDESFDDIFARQFGYTLQTAKGE